MVKVFSRTSRLKSNRAKVLCQLFLAATAAGSGTVDMCPTRRGRGNRSHSPWLWLLTCDHVEVSSIGISMLTGIFSANKVLSMYYVYISSSVFSDLYVKKT